MDQNQSDNSVESVDQSASEDVTEDTRLLAGKSGDEQADTNEPQGAPEEYAEFTMPDGMDVDTGLMAAANPLFKEAGLSQEVAQKFVDLQAQQVAKQADQFSKQQEEWKQAVTNDPKLGGANLERNMGVAMRAVDQYFEPEFLDILSDYGLANNPVVIRGLFKIGSGLTEDNPGGGSPTQQGKSRTERFYGTP